MAGTVTFILKDPKAKVETPIYLVFWYDQFRIKVSTGESIHPSNWNKKTHKVRETKDQPQGGNINITLDSHKVNVLNAARDHLNVNGEIVPSRLKVELKAVVKPPVKVESEPMTLFKSIQEFIDMSAMAKKTKLSYGTTLNSLKKFQETTKYKLTFDSINMVFYKEYIDYLVNIKGFTNNTVGSYIKNIKLFMNYANEKKYTDNQLHRKKEFKKIDETADTIYLNDNEIMTLYKHDLTSNKKLDRIRDLFIIGCHTGLRFSDLSQITPDKFTNNATRLRLKTIKTSETVVIPLHWTIKEILKKYDYKLPRVISNQKFNSYLKDIGREAKINETVMISKIKGGLKFEQKFMKWELISTHTARRSAATNMYLAGVPSISIMKITGHRTERAFMKYIKISQDQNADLLSKHPYFSKSPLKIAK